jgi:RNA polymerase sigma-70 factor (ECF subfamily)
MLQTVLGLDAARIAAAWLVAPATMGQRLVRAKTKIRDTRIRFQLPETAELPARLDSVLDAIYAAYGTGWEDLAPAAYGASATAPGLALEALWLARALAGLLPAEPEALGLLALLLHCEARRPARRDSAGRFVPLSEQNPSAWSLPLIDEAEQTLAAAARLRRPARFQWLAAIQSAHARRARDGRIDRPALLALHEALQYNAPTIGGAVARIAALAEVRGAREALVALEKLALDSPAALAAYQPHHALRAHLLTMLDRPAEAALAYEQAIRLCADPAVAAFLREQRSALPKV